MTLSTVGSSVQQRSRLAQFRTAYAKLTSALKSVTVDQGRIYGCYYDPNDEDIENYGLSIESPVTSQDGACEQLETEYLKALGAVRRCNNAITDGCIPNNYPTESSNFADYNNVRAYVLDNSMIFMVPSGKMNLFAIDTNGRKGPNKWGQDIFPFTVKYTEVKNVNGVARVKAVGILPPSGILPKENYAISSASRSTEEMVQESSGVRLNP